ncbi:MAG: TonB-dependent receptor plug domain-containing protein [Caulobacteraceae bacterium]
MRSVAIPILAASWLLASPVLAETASSVSPLVVTATLVPTPIETAPASITLITAEDIASHQWASLPQALSTAPGLNIVQVGGPGGEASVFIRGADSNHTKVLIDGIEVNDPSQNDAFDFGQVLTWDIAGVEILRGPISSLYGSDALGGVISITTKSGEGRPDLVERAEAGSFATFDQEGSLSGSSGAVEYALEAAHFRAGDTPVTPPGLLAPGERAIGNFYDNLTGSAKLGYRVSDSLKLRLVVRAVSSLLRSTGEDFLVFPATPDAAQTIQRDLRALMRLEADLSPPGSRLDQVFSLDYARFDSRIQGPDEGAGFPAPTIDEGDRTSLSWLGKIRLTQEGTLIVGARDDIDRLIASPINAEDADRAIFAELDASPLAALTAAASGRLDEDQRFGSEATWRLAGSWRWATSGTVLKASAGTGFSAPSLTQLFVSFPAFNFFANPRLRPEQSFGVEAGLQQPIGPIRLGALVFHDSIRDLIAPSAAGTTNVNIGLASDWGWEASASARLSNAFEAKADWTYVVAMDDIAHQELLRRPKDKGDLSAIWRPSGRATLAVSFIYVGAWVDGDRDFSIPRLEASPYAVVDLSASWKATRRFTLFGRIDNLLDRRFQNPVGFLAPDFGVYGGVKADLSGG